MYVDILILAHLSKRPGHGYEIKKRVQRTMGPSMAINNNLLYPALKRFEEMGAVVREVERQEGRPDRHVYHITDRGDEVLQGLLREFPAELARDDSEFIVRVAWFDRLDPQARLDILRTREDVLREHLAHLATALPKGQRPEHPYGERVIAFLTQRVRQELEWIAALRREAEEDIP